MTYDPWKRVDELERRVAELEAQLRLLFAAPPAHRLEVISTAGGGKASTETLHLPKGKH